MSYHRTPMASYRSPTDPLTHRTAYQVLSVEEVPTRWWSSRRYRLRTEGGHYHETDGAWQPGDYVYLDGSGWHFVKREAFEREWVRV